MHRGDSKWQAWHSGAPTTCKEKGYFNDYAEGWLQLHFFSVDLNTKSICPNPRGQSDHITKFPLAGISGYPSMKTEPLHGQGRGHRERKCPRTTFQGRLRAAPATLARENTLVLSFENSKRHDKSFCNISMIVTRKIMRLSSSSLFQKFLLIIIAANYGRFATNSCAKHFTYHTLIYSSITTF